MMKKIYTKDLKEGMQFSSPLFFDDEKNMFLSEGKPLCKRFLSVLSEWNIPFVVTYGHQLSESETILNVEELDELTELEELDEVAELEEEEDEVLLHEVEEKSFNLIQDTVLYFDKIKKDSPSYEIYKSVLDDFNVIIRKIENREKLERDSIDVIIEKLYQGMKSDAFSFQNFVLNDVETESRIKKNVYEAILADALFTFLGKNEREIKQFMVCALLCDLGYIFHANKEVHFVESVMYMTECSRFATDILLYPQIVGKTIEDCREAFDGSGLPKGKVGDDIGASSQYLSVIIYFVEKMLETNSSPIVAHKIMKDIIAADKKMFNKEILETFVQCMGICPVGAFVVLNDSSIARVVNQNSSSPMSPIVAILIDRKGNELTEKVEFVNLENSKNLFITSVLDGAFE